MGKKQSTDIDNLTPFGYDTAFGYDLDDTAMVVLCIAGRFRMPPAGKTYNGPLVPADEQLPPPMADEYWSNPADSSLRYSGQGIVHRPGADIYLQGSAWAPLGRAVTKLRTRIQVGSCTKEVHVVGDRYWINGLFGLTASAPEPFVRIPLVYERSFGGTAYFDDGHILAQESRNPVGRGIYSSKKAAFDQPLPNLVKPGERITSWKSRVTPWGYGPIACSWQPRLSLAGTYDEKWLDERIPLWPSDLNPRFFCSAAPGMYAPESLQGGEAVVLEGFSSDGAFYFYLPKYRIVAKSIYSDRIIRGMMTLDGILLEPEEGTITLFWHRAVPLGNGNRMHLRSIIRLLEPWENITL